MKALNKQDYWADKQKPNLEHIIELFSHTELGAFISGHLLIEAVLVQLIELVMKKNDTFDPSNSNFPEKVLFLKKKGIIHDELKEYLLEINRQRNRLAHRLGEQITFDSMFILVKQAAEAGIDFSDDTVHTNKELSMEHYGTQGIIQEIFQNTAQDLSFIMEEYGGEFQFA